MLKFCPKCGSKLYGDRFCGNCGADLSNYGEGNINENAGSSLDDAMSGLMGLAKEKQAEAEQERLRDFEIVNDVLVHYWGSSKNLVIPNGIKTIGSCFSHCMGLTSVTIPNSVIKIDDCAFKDEKSLTSIVIPNSVRDIGKEAFSFCESLTDIKLSESITKIEYSLFYNCVNLKSIEIPNGVTRIDMHAFQGCKKLTKVRIPYSVELLANAAFKESGLILAEVPRSIELDDRPIFPESCRIVRI